MRVRLMLCSLAVLSGCKTKPDAEIHLKGRLADKGSQEVSMEFTGETGTIGTGRNGMFKTGGEGYFDTILPLREPMYFNISRNILYLSPGDDLEVYLTPDTRQATFKGKGSEAQLFLKDRLYPKGGSFLLSGRNVRENFEKKKEVVDALAASKLAQLDTL